MFGLLIHNRMHNPTTSLLHSITNSTNTTAPPSREYSSNAPPVPPHPPSRNYGSSLPQIIVDAKTTRYPKPIYAGHTRKTMSARRKVRKAPTAVFRAPSTTPKTTVPPPPLDQAAVPITTRSVNRMMVPLIPWTIKR